MRIVDKSRWNRSRPELPTTASGVAQQGTLENYATAKHSENKSRKREGRRVKSQREVWKEKLRVGTLIQRFLNFWCYGAHEEVDHYVRSHKIGSSETDSK